MNLSMSLADLTADVSDELTAAFHDYHRVLRCYSYPPIRFKTPLQRASALQKRQNTVKLEQIEQFQREHLATLLPQGENTRSSVDVFRCVASRGHKWRLRIPVTMVSDGDGCWLLHMSSDGVLCTQKQSARALSFPRFLSHVTLSTSDHRPDFPKYLHKSPTVPVSLHYFPQSAEAVWITHIHESQKLQEFIQPPSSHMSLIRAHWRVWNNVTSYYVLTNGGKNEKAKQSKMRLKSMIRDCSEFRGKKSVEEKFLVNEKNVNTKCIKRTKPHPEIDSQLNEVRKILEATSLHSNEFVEELVCDFILDKHRLPVLINCQGFSFSTSSKPIFKTLQASISEATVSTTPLYIDTLESNEDDDEDEVEEDKTMVEEVKKESPKRVRPGTGDRKRRTIIRRTVIQRPTFPLKKCSYKPSASLTDISISKVATKFDAMRARLKTFHNEQKKCVNFIEKYGGVEFWEPFFMNILRLFRADEQMKQYFDNLNIEESKLIIRSYQRVLEGNYNLYYKKSLTIAHIGLGIDNQVFFQFVKILEMALEGYLISPEDYEAILARFRSFETCICPKA